VTAGAPEPEVAPDPSDGRSHESSLTASELRGLFQAASSWLDRNAQAINAINVFPVPDGDTGSNMAATLRDTLRGVGAGLQTAGEITAAIARGALLSARGNSGVILSQILRGFAEATAGAERLDGLALAQALLRGSKAAYESIEHPVEGTILTVVRAAADAAASMRSADPRPVLEASVTAARAALVRTPDLLPVLKQAGVVDSGGYGLVVLLEGALQFLKGEPAPEYRPDAGAPSGDWVSQNAGHHGGHRAGFGYCTEFVVTGSELDLAGVRGRMNEIGDSVIVVGDTSAVHVHVHTAEPGAVIGLGTSLGSLDHVKIDNMQTQSERMPANATIAEPSPPITPLSVANDTQAEVARIAVIAVVSGDGLAAVARSVGATDVIAGGQTMNPSVAEILRAIDAVPSPEVIVLPNNKNVILSVRQAAASTTKRVSVLQTMSVPQGMSALLAFDATLSSEENVAAMVAAAKGVHTIEVTRAARATRIRDTDVPANRPIALVDGRLEVADTTSEGALVEALRGLAPAAESSVTVYWGSDVNQRAASEAQAILERKLPGLDFQFLRGGQEHYQYIVAVE